jgi:hypothetical protein
MHQSPGADCHKPFAKQKAAVHLEGGCRAAKPKIIKKGYRGRAADNLLNWLLQ